MVKFPNDPKKQMQTKKQVKYWTNAKSSIQFSSKETNLFQIFNKNYNAYHSVEAL